MSADRRLPGSRFEHPSSQPSVEWARAECVIAPSHNLTLHEELDYYWGDGPNCRPVPLRAWRLAEPQGNRIINLPCRSRREEPATQSHVEASGSARTTVFDFTAAMTELVADLVARLPEFSHIRVQQLHVGVTRCGRRPGGLLGRITPLRFPGGTLYRRCGAWQLVLPRYWLRGWELLYLIAFPLPRFFDLPFEEKMITIMHELSHISPQFDGDLYRHSGRYCWHSRSKKAYDRRMALLVRAYLQTRPDESKFAFLRFSGRELLQRYGVVVGEWLPAPRILRLALDKGISMGAPESPCLPQSTTEHQGGLHGC
ncbi:MAG: putative metallopeptidase [Gemmatales bacterium]|nr:putative metallopeptidase [Gemmatales bacterium]MDW7994124.1 putative metallopeptidase [Gemmatales bacterium]